MNKFLAVAVSAGLGLCCTAAVAANRSDAGWVRPNPNIEVPAGGGSCATPQNVGTFSPGSPVTVTGNSCGGANNISNYGGGICDANLPFPYPGPEDVWQFTLTGTPNSVSISADLTGSTGDLAVFVLGTCGDGNSCIASSQDAIGAGAGPEEVTLDANLTPGDYYIYIDSYYGTGGISCGSYSLSLSGTQPVSLTTFGID